MNNKLIGYEEAVKRLKDSERAMRVQKKILRISKDAESQRDIQRAIFLNRREINLLLSIVASEKRARKMWGRLITISGVSSTKRGG